MVKPSLYVLTSLLVVGAAGCAPDIEIDPGEGVDDPVVSGPAIEFDPSKSIIPFPNNLVRNPATKKVTIPAGRCESPTGKAVREGVLNTLDGFGTYQSGLQITLTEPLAPEELAFGPAGEPQPASAKIKLYQRTAGDTPVDKEIPTVLRAGFAVRYLAADPLDCTPSLIPAITIIPLGVLEQNSTHTVAIMSGLKTAAGGTFGPSTTWALVRSEKPPVVFDATGTIVIENNTPLSTDPTGTTGDNPDPAKVAALAATIERLKGIALLWGAHKDALTFLGAKDLWRGDIALAWEFTTQTVTDALDPDVADSPAADCPTDSFVTGGVQLAPGTTAAGQGELFLIGALGAPTCAAIGCANVADVLVAGVASPSYQQLRANPLANEPMIPGPWSDPKNPTVVTPAPAPLGTIIVVPKVTATCPLPANGWPTIIFGHGLGSRKETVFAIAPQLAGRCMATVAIDFQAHGSRAIRNSDAAALGCSGTPTPGAAPQCFAPFLSTDLAGTRDNFRQTILDLQRLATVLATCNAGTGCGGLGPNAGPDFHVNSAKISYAGISLGGIIGTTFTATTPAVNAAVLNVPGVGLLDILENTQTPAIRCSLVNGLIDAGILQGEKFNGTNPLTALCLAVDQGWKTQPGYAQFSGIARWILDPADGANYTPKLALKKVLIQEVVGDMVVPNIATDREAALVGLTGMNADPASSSAPAPSMAIITDAMTSKFIKYPTLPAASPFPGNTFVHSSLLQPANAGNDGTLGTVRLQTDAIAFLLFNNN